MKKLNVLVACEYSGRVRDAFIRRGHNAVSCDFLPSESKFGPHFQYSVKEVDLWRFDLMICHPPCTYLASSGLHWNKRIEGREKLTEEAVEFCKWLMNCGIKRIAMENPVGALSSRYRKPDQIIQPWMFGEDASKKTCLWLKDLPPPGSYRNNHKRKIRKPNCQWAEQAWSISRPLENPFNNLLRDCRSYGFSVGLI